MCLKSPGCGSGFEMVLQGVLLLRATDSFAWRCSFTVLMEFVEGSMSSPFSSATWRSLSQLRSVIPRWPFLPTDEPLTRAFNLSGAHSQNLSSYTTFSGLEQATQSSRSSCSSLHLPTRGTELDLFVALAPAGQRSSMQCSALFA